MRIVICLEEQWKMSINMQKGQARERYFSRSARTQRSYDSNAIQLKVLAQNRV